MSKQTKLPPKPAPPGEGSKTGLIVGLVITAMVLVFVVFAVFVFVIQKAPAGSDLIAERFLTDKIQADKKADIVIFPSNVLEQPGFTQKVDAAKQAVRSGGYMSEPQLVRPKRFTTTLQDESVYKICKADNQSCVYFWIETRSKNQGPRTRRAIEVMAFDMYQTEAEAVARYGD